MARGVLVSYAGYPYTPSSLMPDNGLANLAGALVQAGHEVRVLDYSTVDLIRRLIPPEDRRRLAAIYDGLSRQSPNALDRAKAMLHLWRLRKQEKRLANYQRRELSRIFSELSRIIEADRLHFVGFKLWNGDGFAGSITLAHQIKQAYPHVAVFAGGPQVDMFREAIYRFTDAFDCLIFAEGEHVIAALADSAANGRSLDGIPNVIFKKDGAVCCHPVEWITNLDSLPLPNYDAEVYPAFTSDQRMRIVVLDESRGCPFGCHFCIQPIKSGPSLRIKSPDRIVHEIHRVIDRYGIKAFRYAGSTTPGTLMVNVARLLEESHTTIRYSAFAEANMVVAANLGLLRESGLEALFLGLESANQGLLDQTFGKRLTKQKVEEVVQAAKAVGVFTVVSVIVPAPGETTDSEKETLDFLTRVRPDSVPVQFPGVMPATRWYTNSEDFGITLNKEEYLNAAVVYKIKLLYPPRFWGQLPCKVNGKGFRAFTKETEQFARALEANGILVGVPDDNVLMARMARLDPREFRDSCRRSFYIGDAEAIESLVATINRASSEQP